MMDNDKHRTDRQDSRMDSTEGGGCQTEESVDLQATFTGHPPINTFVTPSRVCDTYSEELWPSLTSRTHCSPTEASTTVNKLKKYTDPY